MLVTLHDRDASVECHDPDFSVLEELARPRSAGPVRSTIPLMSFGMDEVGDGLAVVVLHRVGALIKLDGRGPVAVDEQPVLVDDHRVRGDLGEEPVAVDQVGQFPLEPLLGGDVDDCTEVDVSIGDRVAPDGVAGRALGDARTSPWVGAVRDQVTVRRSYSAGGAPARIGAPGSGRARPAGQADDGGRAAVASLGPGRGPVLAGAGARARRLPSDENPRTPTGNPKSPSIGDDQVTVSVGDVVDPGDGGEPVAGQVDGLGQLERPAREGRCPRCRHGRTTPCGGCRRNRSS